MLVRHAAAAGRILLLGDQDLGLTFASRHGICSMDSNFDSAETSTQLPFYPLDREARSVPVGRRVLQSNDFDTRKHSCHSWY